MLNRLIQQIVIGLIVSCLAIFNVKAQESFKGIIPMVTTKNEVEKKLGKLNEKGVYELDEGRVTIRYYEQQCQKKTECICLVPLETVQYISVTLYYDLYLKDLNLDPQKFKETNNPHLPDIFTYSNSKTGVTYEASEGKVYEILYYESEETCNNVKQKFLEPEKLNNSNAQNNSKVVVSKLTPKKGRKKSRRQ
jgi:hypothetical protein